MGKGRLLLWLVLAVLVIVPLCIFVIPLASCPNCSGTAGDEGTYGTYDKSGKQIVLGCNTCDGHRITLYRKWTYKPFPP